MSVASGNSGILLIRNIILILTIIPQQCTLLLPPMQTESQELENNTKCNIIKKVEKLSVKIFTEQKFILNLHRFCFIEGRVTIPYNIW